ncbi:Dual specificity protein kinase TTK-like protein [Aphelenchoides besseyi]|nr:Dual specificity protein kinase TTK-like protein [Aphelenchoides besseyi]
MRASTMQKLEALRKQNKERLMELEARTGTTTSSNNASEVPADLRSSSSGKVASTTPVPSASSSRAQPEEQPKMTKSTMKPSAIVVPVAKKSKPLQSPPRAAAPVLPKIPTPLAQRKIVRSTGNELAKGTEITVNETIFTIDSCIGSGGSCKVYKAFSRDYKNPVALKIVNRKKSRQRNDADVQERDPFPQRAPGISLRDQNARLEREMKKRFDESSIRYYWSEMVKCVNVIHSRKIVHADLKPANFVLVKGSIKLIDFGIAAQITADDTTVCRKQIQGTLNYISPEAVNCPPDAEGYESDVWSLGCILYAMHFGRAPFANAGSQDRQILAIREAKIVYPKEPRMPFELENVLKCCLTRNLAERLSVEELLEHPYVSLKSNSENMAEMTVSEEQIVNLLKEMKDSTPRTIAKNLKSVLKQR